jgi:hypothetical protein
MDMKKYSGSAFLKLDDVRGAPRRERVASVSEGKFGKPVLVFESGARLSLNVTNNRVLVRAFGDESDGWVGCDLDLRLGKVEVQGELKEIVLVEPISPKLPLAAEQATHRSRPIPF